MYFLGIIDEKDAVKGKMRPSYVLASKTQSMNQNYSPWQVVRVGRIYETLRRVLVASLYGNDMLIDFMSNYRTRVNSKEYKKFFPKGVLCWFPCDNNGNQTGAPVFIKRVPDKTNRFTDDKWQRMKKELLREKYLNERLTKDDRFYPLVFSQIVPLVMQTGLAAADHELEKERFINERRIYGKRKAKT